MVNPTGKIRGAYLGYALPAEQRKELLEELFVFGKDNQKPFLTRMTVLLVISTIIASAGLLANSAAVVIGAMLVAPMMRPVMSSAAAITLSWGNRLYQSLLLITWMAIGAVIISAAFAWAAPDMVFLPKEIIARTKPTFYDLAIALASGAGGAYTLTRKETSAIPGVAMAVALLPPLASTGILLVYIEFDLALKAFVLFATNFAAMIFAGAVTFRFVGVKPKRSSARHIKYERGFLIAFAFLLTSISIPLYFYSQEVWYDAMYKAEKSENLQNWLKRNKAKIVNVRIDTLKQVLYLDIQSPVPPLNLKSLYDSIHEERKQTTGREDPFTIEVVWTQGVHLTWPVEEHQQELERELKRDYLPELKRSTWIWTGTQYADGKWLKPENGLRFDIRVRDKNRFNLRMECANIYGTYSLNQEILNIQLKPHKKCADSNVANRLVADLNSVTGVKLKEDYLALQMLNNSGVIYFESDKPEL